MVSDWPLLEREHRKPEEAYQQQLNGAGFTNFAFRAKRLLFLDYIGEIRCVYEEKGFKSVISRYICGNVEGKARERCGMSIHTCRTGRISCIQCRIALAQGMLNKLLLELRGVHSTLMNTNACIRIHSFIHRAFQLCCHVILLSSSLQDLWQ